jgi:hypothetical protein
VPLMAPLVVIALAAKHVIDARRSSTDVAHITELGTPDPPLIDATRPAPMSRSR